MMCNEQKTCIDRILPSDLHRFSQPKYSLATSDGFRERLAVFRDKKWPVGHTLQVRFMGGTAEQWALVRQVASEWTLHANLKFNFNNASDAEIRISFDSNLGSWSYIGTDCLNIPSHQATMNFGWLDKAVVLHEFGHAIGLIHEHQNPEGGIRWNKEKVYEDLGGPPNNWDKATIDHNVFRTYSQDQLNGTKLDKYSIMMYPIPQSWTLDNFSSDFNPELSAIDKTFIGESINYPFEEPNPAVELTVAEIVPVNGELRKSDDEDTYVFSATQIGLYTIETSGQTDVVMSLSGPDNPNTLVIQDDDSGIGVNAKIKVNLTELGQYFVKVAPYDESGGIGPYQILAYSQAV